MSDQQGQPAAAGPGGDGPNLLGPQEGEKWLLRLYVAGRTPKCVTALENLQRFCEEHMAGRYEIEVVDLLENPKLARDDQIIAIPTLVKRLPEPLKKIIGNLSDAERMLVGLDMKQK